MTAPAATARTCAKRSSLLDAAGYELKGTTLRARNSGRPFRFEIMVTSRDDERLALAFASNLARAGIEAQVRLVDAVQYDQRRMAFDFDMIQYRWEQSLSPGNEQSFYWGSAAADEQGSRNYMGVRSPAIDAMIAAMLRARERPDFVAAVRALDRLLISGCYVVPLFYLPAAMGGALDLYRASRPARRCSATCRKPGGTNRNGRCNDPRRRQRPPLSPTERTRVTIDDIFRRHARRRPDALALIDAANRESFTDGRPHRLTYAEADRIVAAIAARLRDMGLPTDCGRRHPIAQYRRECSGDARACCAPA